MFQLATYQRRLLMGVLKETQRSPARALQTPNVWGRLRGFSQQQPRQRAVSYHACSSDWSHHQQQLPFTVQHQQIRLASSTSSSTDRVQQERQQQQQHQQQHSDREGRSPDSSGKSSQQDQNDGLKARMQHAGAKMGDMRDKASARYDELREDWPDRKEHMREQAKEAAASGKKTLKEMWRRYGLVAVGTYFGIYVVTLGSLYVVFSNGFMTASDVPAGAEHAISTLQHLVERLPDWAERQVNRLYEKMAAEPRFRSFALAWITCKITEPVRLFLTAVITPRVARAVGRAPPAERKEKEKGAESNRS